MKKTALIILFFAGLGTFTFAQNAFKVTIGTGLCLANVSVVYTNDNVASFDLGCAGEYSFDTGTNVVETVTIHDVVCRLNETVDVLDDNDKAAEAKLASFSQFGRHISVSAP